MREGLVTLGVMAYYLSGYLPNVDDDIATGTAQEMGKKQFRAQRTRMAGTLGVHLFSDLSGRTTNIFREMFGVLLIVALTMVFSLYGMVKATLIWTKAEDLQELAAYKMVISAPPLIMGSLRLYSPNFINLFAMQMASCEKNYAQSAMLAGGIGMLQGGIALTFTFILAEEEASDLGSTTSASSSSSSS